jgi:hypothetical protein
MAESKSAALPLGYAPFAGKVRTLNEPAGQFKPACGFYTSKGALAIHQVGWASRSI